MMNDTIDSTRRMASDAMERASSTMKDLRAGMSDRASAARGYMGEYASASTRYVSEHPMKSALIAAAVGAAVAGLYLAMRHRRELQDRYF
ncbi:DUF883 family protein [Ramlibacter sp. USB13]|uniref:DUF883 family protein n=1 Tax=Ramlibacter cellulosilyticus TaxID=2764187 RepID=A0A923MN36_9BURK|nr:DUF883 family protein [Ramlibacter cellulosilyticus]MBC5781776.1 DUF883 family protein [Ramlibacter cellulosilyticus]